MTQTLAFFLHVFLFLKFWMAQKIKMKSKRSGNNLEKENWTRIKKKKTENLFKVAQNIRNEKKMKQKQKAVIGTNTKNGWPDDEK